MGESDWEVKQKHEKPRKTEQLLAHAIAEHQSHRRDRDADERTSFSYLARVLDEMPDYKPTEHTAILEYVMLKVIRALTDPAYNPDHYIDMAAFAAMAGQARATESRNELLDNLIARG